MKVLITGGAGFIGSHIAEAALREKHEVVIVDDLSNGKRSNIPLGATFYECSILDGDWPHIVEVEQPSIIFHEAAQPSLRRSIEEPEFDAGVNIIGTLAVIRAARGVGAHIVFASTSAVFAPDAPVPFMEEDGGQPNLPYGIAKYACELYIRNAGLSYTILRYGNVYGPRQVPIGENQLIPHCIRYLKGLEPDFGINGDGEQRRDFIFVEDIADANLRLGGIKAKGTYNIATGVGTSVNQVCRMLANIADKPVLFPHHAAKRGETRDSILLVQKAGRVGWRARTTLQQGLQATWESFVCS